MVFFAVFGALAIVYPNYTLVDSNAFERGLVVEEVSATSIVTEHSRVSKTSEGKYAGKKKEVLTFITPWNSDGYNLTLAFGAKFSTVVPVWFRALHVGDSYKIEGLDAVRVDWLEQMRGKYPHLRIMPRLNFEIGVVDFDVNCKRVTSSLKEEVLKLMKAYKFDGLFLEFPMSMSRLSTIRSMAFMVKELRKALPRKARIYADIPSNDKAEYGVEAIAQTVKGLINALDCVFISLYELAAEESLSPVKAATNLYLWTQRLGITKRVIVGLPLFGFDYSNEGIKHIFGDSLITVLQDHAAKVAWVDKPMEHAIFYESGIKQHVVYYPSLFFLNDRLERTMKNGFAGVGFWELAQGLPYFFDVL